MWKYSYSSKLYNTLCQMGEYVLRRVWHGIYLVASPIVSGISLRPCQKTWFREKCKKRFKTIFFPDGKRSCNFTVDQMLIVRTAYHVWYEKLELPTFEETTFPYLKQTILRLSLYELLWHNTLCKNSKKIKKKLLARCALLTSVEIKYLPLESSDF